MKKFFFAALLAVPVLFSCNKEKEEAIKITPPKAADSALSIEFSTLPSVSINGNAVDIQTIEFFRSGNYMITAVPTKAAGVLHYSGSFTFSNGVYTLSGDYSGQIVVAGDAVTVDGENYPASTSKPQVTSGSFEDLLYRSWAIESIEFALTSPKLTQRVPCSPGNNVSAAVEVANRVGASISGLYGRDVQSIDLSAGAVMLRFVNGETYGGTWTLSSDNVTYNFDEEFSSGFLNKSSSGKLVQSGEKLKGTIKVDTAQLKGDITITVSQAD